MIFRCLGRRFGVNRAAVSLWVAGQLLGGGVLAQATQHPAQGVSLCRFAVVDDGVYKGSKPKSDADFRFLQNHHTRYILQLNFLPWLSGAEKRTASKYGIEFLSVLMNASPLSPSEDHVNRVLCILRDKRLHPIYLHCDIGRDRTGLILGLYDVYYKGMSPQQAWENMKEFGFKDSWTLHGLKSYFERHTQGIIRPPACGEWPPD